MLEALQHVNVPFTFFGGEPLLLSLEHLEELMKLAYEKHGGASIQTNGTLITDAHIDLFDKYRVSVGMSLDGPVELNDSRWAGTKDATRKQSEKTHEAIRKLTEKSLREGKAWLLPSIIVTLHAGNCSTDNFPIFCKWLFELDAMGLKHIDLHAMELDYKADELFIPQLTIADRIIDLWNLPLKNLRFFKQTEILQLLRGDDDHTNCVWHACDPWATQAVQSIDHDGTPGQCVRTFKDGKKWLPAEGAPVRVDQAGFPNHPTTRYHERQLALYVTPQEHLGCKGCEYWLICMGNCPGEANDKGDWRTRSTYCTTYKKLFAWGEQELGKQGELPISLWPNRQALEERMYQLWAQGHTPSLASLIKETAPGEKGWDAATGHGDFTDAHGDWHGDHQDGPNKEVVDM